MDGNQSVTPATSGRTTLELSRSDLMFSSAHFAQRADGTSEPLHGHNYSISVRIHGKTDALGYVIDFSLLKSKLRAIIGELNHRVLLPGHSCRMSIVRDERSVEVVVDGKRYVLPVSDVVVLPLLNTTCEQLAAYIGNAVGSDLLAGQLEIKIEESPGQGASWSSSDDR